MLEYSLSCGFVLCDARMRLHLSVSGVFTLQPYIKAISFRVGLNRRKRNIISSLKVKLVLIIVDLFVDIRSLDVNFCCIFYKMMKKLQLHLLIKIMMSKL